MSKHTSSYPVLVTDGSGSGVVSQAGAVLLLRTAETVGLTSGLPAALVGWRRPTATHDPGKILLDLAVQIALGGDCLADIGMLRAEPGVFGSVASDPTVSRLITTLAADATAAVSAIRGARAAARARAWHRAGVHAPDHDADAHRPVTIDLDATLLEAHSDKESAAPTYKRGYGFHPLGSWVDHGPDGSGEPLVMLLRPGNAGANTAADHTQVLDAAIAQLPGAYGYRVGQKVLVRTDAAGGTHEFVSHLHKRRLQYSVGFGLSETTAAAVDRIPDPLWQPAINSDGEVRDGAWVAELTGLIELSGWPPGMRVIVRKERPHPGAQLRFTDHDGLRLTAFATNTRPGGPGRQLADLELRHRRRARCEDRIRAAKDTGLTNLPLHDFAANRIWIEIAALAAELTAWMQLLALPDHPTRRWEPKRLRLCLFSVAGRIARHARQTRLRLPTHWPWTEVITIALARLQPG